MKDDYTDLFEEVHEEMYEFSEETGVVVLCVILYKEKNINIIQTPYLGSSFVKEINNLLLKNLCEAKRYTAISFRRMINSDEPVVKRIAHLIDSPKGNKCRWLLVFTSTKLLEVMKSFNFPITSDGLRAVASTFRMRTVDHYASKPLASIESSTACQTEKLYDYILPRTSTDTSIQCDTSQTLVIYKDAEGFYRQQEEERLRDDLPC